MEKTMNVKILDVRDMAPRERHPMIFDTFKGLEPGESFILINDHAPKPLLYQFQNEHDGEFDWWPLEEGPEAWRVEIARRTEPDPDRTVTEYLQTDHRRLDGILNRFQGSVKEGRWEDASREFREFNHGLRRHIRIEESILFPAFEEKTGMHDSGPTFVMRMEHKEIHELLDSILGSADARDEAGVDEGVYAFTNVLANHNMKEENILYPESDAFLSNAERAQVVKRAQAL